MGKSRVGEAVLQFAVVGQEKQAFAVVIQTADRVYAGHGNEVRQSSFGSLAGELAQNVERFVEEQITKGQGKRVAEKFGFTFMVWL